MTRIAVVEKDKCHPLKCGDLCIKLCPVNRTGKNCIVKDENGKASIEESLCTGCGICQNRCPFKAISIINLPEDLNSNPIHRYGQNGFHLFNLPIPIFGKVVGILGRNGIGKSTALKILSGLIKPNLGKEESNYEELSELFKGNEAQIFFEKLAKGDIKISYKPQQVDLIPKNASGTVNELLSKVDEKGKKNEYAKILEIDHIMNNDISNISGGELQRVAIAACVLKKANVYFFDEPTSYLDIKQRIKISRFIKNLCNEDTAVMVVEHDLIILDYMTELIHIMYGKPSCYGIVSQPKSTKAGINIYLSGFMKEENIRFRDKKISFEEKIPVDLSETPDLISWKNISLDLGQFHLDAKEGKLSKKVVTGILGPNGTGKTSFIKVLAGVTKAKGSIEGDVKVSYKPQYLQGDSDEVVASVLSVALEKYETTLINPLEIVPLLEKQINQLSGGELQRVAIALALSKDADLYLLDEPSAYLDVEQRLKVSKIIRDIIDQKGKTAIVVDHDLLFIDYLSHAIVVFEGEAGFNGEALGPFSMAKGMNKFLSDIDMTLRRDQESHRPRVNKSGSQMDQKQKNEGKLYYN